MIDFVWVYMTQFLFSRNNHAKLHGMLRMLCDRRVDELLISEVEPTRLDDASHLRPMALWTPAVSNYQSSNKETIGHTQCINDTPY